MENVEIANLLNKYADLLEIQGADLFRIQAYRNAARTIESLSQPVSQLVQEGKDLKKLKLPGIGKGMSEHLEEIVKTGSLGALNELRKELPGSLDELLEIEGLGPKRTKLLYDKLGISSIKQLERALESDDAVTVQAAHDGGGIPGCVRVDVHAGSCARALRERVVGFGACADVHARKRGLRTVS